MSPPHPVGAKVRKDQDTRVVGYTYGLRQVANFPLLDAVPFREAGVL